MKKKIKSLLIHSPNDAMNSSAANCGRFKRPDLYD